ncbi:hypothetical protein F3Y22_tig00002237pilonHSYRG00583 [Hibiscus syriacus]|uniref:Uncharacterized protein n=1 Tax=Hibiscus syriacus TaxID=106335 RepID=A0A6A3CRK0_HIBSY|nr:hypothetical protein F3Y22_tig00002237pilonHSYRG00583 [Hibiscus syriacus]
MMVSSERKSSHRSVGSPLGFPIGNGLFGCLPKSGHGHQGFFMSVLKIGSIFSHQYKLVYYKIDRESSTMEERGREVRIQDGVHVERKDEKGNKIQYGWNIGTGLGSSKESSHRRCDSKEELGLQGSYLKRKVNGYIWEAGLDFDSRSAIGKHLHPERVTWQDLPSARWCALGNTPEISHIGGNSKKDKRKRKVAELLFRESVRVQDLTPISHFLWVGKRNELFGSFHIGGEGQMKDLIHNKLLSILQCNSLPFLRSPKATLAKITDVKVNSFASIPLSCIFWKHVSASTNYPFHESPEIRADHVTVPGSSTLSKTLEAASGIPHLEYISIKELVTYESECTSCNIRSTGVRRKESSGAGSFPSSSLPVYSMAKVSNDCLKMYIYVDSARKAIPEHLASKIDQGKDKRLKLTSEAKVSAY